MIELRIHGRGGQGGVTLAKILATARFRMGESVQAFGLYAAERSGAPVLAFCRFSRQPITVRNIVYEPDHIIVLDPTLVDAGLLGGLKAGGWIILNTPETPSEFAGQFHDHPIATIDATGLARANRLGTRSVPIVNTALAGAVARVLSIALPTIHDALRHLGFGDANLRAAEQAFEGVRAWIPSDEVTVAKSQAGEPPAERDFVSEGVTGVDAKESEPPPLAVLPVARHAASFLAGDGGAVPQIRTGQWATLQPHRRQMVSPCNHACPAGNDVQGFLQSLARDAVDEALEILLQTNPFPSVCGRVCPAPCMAQCNRVPLGGPVNVRELERLAGDRGSVTLTAPPPRGLRIAIVGSGPAGLSAAYQLARLGYPCTIFESGPELGGLLRTGIPEFRLPRDVFSRELDRILALGVEVRTDQRVDRPALFRITQSFDAVLVATGLQESRQLRLGLGDSQRVWQGIDFLDRARQGGIRLDGEEVIVVGGGNTAMDAARTSVRLGAASVRVFYRRLRQHMPAILEEVDEALDEGVVMEFLAQPIAARESDDETHGGGKCVVTFRRVKPAERDGRGQTELEEIPGSEFEVVGDRLILALGQSPDMSVFPEGTEVCEGQHLLGLTETPIFAIGDLATHDGTVAGAIGSGRRAAGHIHQVLTGDSPAPLPRSSTVRKDVSEFYDHVVRPESMKLHLFEKRHAPGLATIPLGERRSTFEEVHVGLHDASEARWCLSCGVCNECDLCRTYCPEGALKRVGHEYVFDYAFCKGCGICASECPRNVIFMSHL